MKITQEMELVSIKNLTEEMVQSIRLFRDLKKYQLSYLINRAQIKMIFLKLAFLLFLYQMIIDSLHVKMRMLQTVFGYGT
jgi:hypothetical protein